MADTVKATASSPLILSSRGLAITHIFRPARAESLWDWPKLHAKMWVMLSPGEERKSPTASRWRARQGVEESTHSLPRSRSRCPSIAGLSLKTPPDYYSPGPRAIQFSRRR
jgi:hypothetical protein